MLLAQNLEKLKENLRFCLPMPSGGAGRPLGVQGWPQGAPGGPESFLRRPARPCGSEVYTQTPDPPHVCGRML